VAVLRGGQRGHAPRELCPSLNSPIMKLVARSQGYTTAVFTAWHRIAGVKLQHSLKHALGLPEFLPSSQIQMWPPRWPPQTAAPRNAPRANEGRHALHNLGQSTIKLLRALRRRAAAIKKRCSLIQRVTCHSPLPKSPPTKSPLKIGR